MPLQYPIISVVLVFFILTLIFLIDLKTHPNCRVPVIRHIAYHGYPAVRVSLEAEREYRSQDKKHRNHGNYLEDKKNNAINTTTPVSNNMIKVVEYDFRVYKIRFIY